MKYTSNPLLQDLSKSLPASKIEMSSKAFISLAVIK